jgi:hypothetical protein
MILAVGIAILRGFQVVLERWECSYRMHARFEKEHHWCADTVVNIYITVDTAQTITYDIPPTYTVIVGGPKTYFFFSHTLCVTGTAVFTKRTGVENAIRYVFIFFVFCYALRYSRCGPS